jgi:hypothetical protein
MVRVWIILAVAVFCVLTAQAPDPRVRAALDALAGHVHQLDGNADISYYCPMDPDVRSVRPGTCTRCGMTLVEGAPDIIEYPLDLNVEPQIPRPNELIRLTFGLTDPRMLQPVRRFEVVHEKLYHLFLVSEDLSFFLHTHPDRQGDEDFHLDVRLPKPGLYRILSDFYPSGGTPQLITSTIIVPGPASTEPPALQSDLSPKQTENAHVQLSLVPEHPVAGNRTSLLFKLTPAEGLETYLGAWGHMLAASADLIEMIHGHPASTADIDGGAAKQLEFSMAFPRAGVYRVWMQFQRLGTVNTVAFDIPVR